MNCSYISSVQSTNEITPISSKTTCVTTFVIIDVPSQVGIGNERIKKDCTGTMNVNSIETGYFDVTLNLVSKMRYNLQL